MATLPHPAVTQAGFWKEAHDRRQAIIDELFRRFDAGERLTPAIDEFLEASNA